MKLITVDTLKKFWEIEGLPHSRHSTREEQACEEHFQRTNKTDNSLSNYPSKRTPYLSAIPSNKRNAASTHFSDDLLEMKVDAGYAAFIKAKTRAAPIKTYCVPRLELCAVFMGAQLLQSISNALEDERFSKVEVFAWTNSTVTLAWITSHPSCWKTFVANRVTTIQKAVPSEQ